jgi:hypothetical protein
VSFWQAEGFIESLELDMNREQYNMRSLLERIDQQNLGKISFEQSKQVRKHRLWSAMPAASGTHGASEASVTSPHTG